MDIANIVNKQFSAAEEGYKHIAHQRLKALKFYRQETEGYVKSTSQNHSQVKTSNVRDTVETILPQVLEPFLKGEAVVFTGDGTPQDEAMVEIESEAVNKVLDVDNNRFELLEMWFRDALLQKNGYVKTFVHDDVKRKAEKVQGLNFDQLAQLEQSLQAQEIEDLTIEADVGGEKLDPKELDEATLMTALFDVSFIHVKRKQKIKIANVAPENIRISPNWNSVSLKGCPYVGESVFMMRGELKELYPDKEAEIDNLPPYYENDTEENTARRQDDQKGLMLTGTDKQTEMVELREHYIKANFDDTDKLKMWKVCTGGSGNVVLYKEMISDNPYDVVTPIRQPHQHYGMSVADLMIDIDEIDTVMWRNSLDGMYRSLLLRPLVDINAVDPKTTLNDLTNTNPFAPIRVRGRGAIEWTAPPDITKYTTNLFPLIDGMLEKRTGMSRMAQGLDATALADSTNQVGSMVMNQSLQRIKMVLRTFAETGVRDLMLRIRNMLLDMGLLPMGGPDDRDVEAKVGVGLTDRSERIATDERTIAVVEKIIAQQGGVSDFSMVNSQNAYKLVMDYLKNLGQVNRDSYITDPSKIPPPPEEEAPIDAALEVEKGKMIVQANSKAADLEFQKKKHADDLRLELLRLQAQEREKGRQFQLELARLRETAMKESVNATP